ncbi:DUF4238 domain-containing protein [Pseudomonas syringae]|uniref:DUF4238 domain-containing protein n=1 Tax=Pseudomonas syringae TaxID=317 RepID=UPI003F754613
MASNKNQHYVPRCYLKPFTINGENTAINVFNLDRHRFIPCAPVKNQCSGDYFYGRDDLLEGAIQSVEQGYAAVLRKVLSPAYKLQQGDCDVLRIFWLFQYLRTEGACLRAVEMSEEMFDEVPVGPNYAFGIKDAVQTAMGVFAEEIDVVSDLKVCLIKNATKTPFVTSDDPAVLTNRWQLEDKRTRNKSLGLKGAGAILLLPLSPNVYCIAYDPDVYSISSDAGWLTVRKPSDVKIFNEFQLNNCRANLYLGDACYAPDLHDFVATHEHRRPIVRHMINYAAYEGEGTDNHKKYRVVHKSDVSGFQEVIMHAQTISTPPTAWPTFLLRRNKSSAYYNGSGIGYLRLMHAQLAESHRPFFKVSPYI